MALDDSEMSQDSHLVVSSPKPPAFEGTPVEASYTFRLVRLIDRRVTCVSGVALRGGSGWLESVVLRNTGPPMLAAIHNSWLADARFVGSYKAQPEITRIGPDGFAKLWRAVADLQDDRLVALDSFLRLDHGSTSEGLA